MTILVTGGAGYIGSHTVLSLLLDDEDIIVLDNFSNSSPIALNRIEELSRRKFKCYHGDIRDRGILKKIFDENNITDVIHFAGLKSVSESLKKPLEYYDNNVSGTLVLLDEMIIAGVKGLIFSSSATVYGEPEYVPLNEQCKVGGTTNPYGTSKLMVEKILEDFSKAHHDFYITILRYFNPAGAHESGMIGEDPNGIPNNLIPYISQVAIGKIKSLSVFGNDYLTKDGTGIRDYIHVMDLSAGHIAALKHRDKNNSFKIYNLGTGRGYSVLDVIHAFQKSSGIKINYHVEKRRAGDIAECWSDPSLAQLELGWVANRDIDEMMDDTWRWQSNNPNGYK